MDSKDEARLRVQTYLEQNKKRLQAMSVDFIVTDVRIFAPGVTTAVLPDSDLRATVAVWRSLNGPSFIFPTEPPPTPAESKLKDTVKNAVTSKTDEPEIEHDGGKVKLTIGGPTAELKKGDVTLSAGVSWGGTLSVEAEKGNFHFAGELSTDHWQITLSYPEDTTIPDLSKLGGVIKEGESSMRKIIGATSGFRNLNDVARIKDAVSPHIKPVSDAVEALKGIAKAPPKGGVSFGVSVGSPDPSPGQTGMPSGVQAQFTLTLRF